MDPRVLTRCVARSLVGAVLVTSAVACGGDDDGDASSAEEGAFGDDWQPFEVEGQFSVELPDEPDEETTAAGDLTIEFYTVLHDDGGVTVSVTPLGDVPDEQIDATLAGAVDGAARNIGGTVVSDEPTDASGYPARDAEIEATSGGQSILVFTRVALHEDRLFQLQSLGRQEDRDVVLADFNRLTDTFEPLGA